MPIQLDVKRKLCTRSDRVKCVEFHPTEPWILSCLYNGCAQIHNYETQMNVKTFEIGSTPVRAGTFVVRKNWVVFGSDDMVVRVYNYNTLEKVKEFEAHSDYLRSIVAHPTQSLLLTSSDDMTIKMWDWDNKWSLKQTFEGHIHYVMQIALNPRDLNTFATASLDRTVKVWQLGSAQPNFTLEGHERGVNCVCYFSGERPYIISGGDDNAVKIWDYQNKSCVQTINAHYQNVNFVLSLPSLPLILSGSEDGTVKCWHSSTYRLESMLNYSLERCWTGCCLKTSNEVAFGYDVGTVVVKLGRERPAVSMDKAGKVVWAKHCEIQQSATTGLGLDTPEGGRLPLSIKEMGNCEVFPNYLAHSPNGRFIAVCGDGEYIIYTSVALRNKAYGPAQDFAWSQDPSLYATRQGNEVQVFKNFKEFLKIRADSSSTALFGGRLLGVATKDSLVFYDWETGSLVCRVEIVPKLVSWSESGELVAIGSDEDTSFFILRLDAEKLTFAPSDEEQLSQALEISDEVPDSLVSGVWTAGDCFIYTTAANKLNYYVGGHTVNLSHSDKPAYIIGYSPDDNRILLIDKDLSITVKKLDQRVLEYQTAIIQKNFDLAKRILPTIPADFRGKIAQFLEKQQLYEQALEVTVDGVHKFELAMRLRNIDAMVKLAEEVPSEFRWKQVVELALKTGRVDLAEHSLRMAGDLPGLLMWAKSTGNAELLQEVANISLEKKNFNIAFLAYFTLGQARSCFDVLVQSNRFPEAAFFCYVYLPSQLENAVRLWREELSKTNKRIAVLLPTPSEYKNLFPGFDELLERERIRDSDLGTAEDDEDSDGDAGSRSDFQSLKSEEWLDEPVAAGSGWSSGNSTE